MRTFVVSAVLLSLTLSIGFAAIDPSVDAPAGALGIGWNLIALPAIPTNPSPIVVLNAFDTVNGTPVDDGTGLDMRRLYRFDGTNKNLIAWDSWSPDTFGGMLIGDGFWIKLLPGDPTTFSFEGITDNDTTDMWISLPTAGWHLIGHPFSYPAPAPDPSSSGQYHMGNPYPWASVKVTDGTVTKSLLDASQYGANWLRSVGYFFNSTNQSIVDIGLPEDWPSCDTLVAWHGYWIRTNKDNLALIMDAMP